MENNIQKLTSLTQELQTLVVEIAWTEKWKIIEIKEKAELMIRFTINEPEKALEVKNEIEDFIKDVDQMIVDVKKELAA